MKKLIFAFVLILFTSSCDDGELTIENFNFGNATPTTCNAGQTGFFIYKTSGKEVIILKIGESKFLDALSTEKSFNIPSEAQVIYRIYSDPISASLDIKSIVMGASSHRYSWEIKDNELYVNFKNIMLPDSNINERASHGFIKFKIKPNTKITVKDLISNTAAIYFDFNEPIFTNKVLLNEKNTKNNEPNINLLDFDIYPNPTSGKLSVRFQSEQNGTANLRIFNVLGSIVKEHTATFDKGENTFDLDLSDLPNGTYCLDMGQAQKYIFIKEQ